MEIKVMPNSIEAEQILLGCLLVDGNKIIEIPALQATDFHYAEHQIIYRAMLSLQQRKLGIDAISVSAGDQSIDTEYINQLVDSALLTSNVSTYSQLIRRLAMQRTAIKLSTQFIDTCFARDIDYDTKHTNFIQQISQLSTINQSQVYSITDVSQVIQQMAESKRRLVTTNDPYLDTALNGGFSLGQLVIIAGKTGMGKTTCAMHLLTNISTKTDCMLFSLEMTVDELSEKIYMNANNEALISTKNLDAVHKFERLAIIDSPIVDINFIKKHIVNYRQQHGSLDVIIIDYLQIMHRAQGVKDYEFLSQTTRELKLLAKEMQLVVICLSQLNRNDTERREKRPTLNDLRGSGTIEQDADLIMFIHREEYYYQCQGKDVPKSLANMMELIIAKFRRFKTSKLLYNCNLASSRLLRCTDDDKTAYQVFLKKQD